MTPKRWIIAGFAVGVLVLLFVLVLVQNAVSRKNEAQARWEEKIGQIRTLTKDGKIIPSMDLLKNMGNQRTRFVASLEIMLTTLKKDKGVRAYDSPLAFKGDLFKVQRALQARAQELSIPIPSDMGFKEFTGKEIPAAASVEDLAFQLAKIKDFMDLLLDCPVAEVKELQRGASRQERIEPDEDIPFYQEFIFRVHFFCASRTFGKFLSSLSGKDSLFVMEDCEVRLHTQDAVEVQATIKAVSFSRTQGI